MRIKAFFTGIFLCLLFAGFAQEKKGTFSGSVKASATKTPLYEAVITLSSPVLEGKRYAATDSAGTYKINNLPKGTYSITIEMEGFDTITYENIFLPEGMSQGVSVEMRRMRTANYTKGDKTKNNKKSKG
jgi:hypothetical protein